MQRIVENYACRSRFSWWPPPALSRHPRVSRIGLGRWPREVKYSVRFTLRQSLVFITCLQAWFGALASGHYLLGSYGVLTFGLFHGIALILLFRLVIRWHACSVMERVMFIVAITASVSAAIYLSLDAYRTGFYLDCLVR